MAWTLCVVVGLQTYLIEHGVDAVCGRWLQTYLIEHGVDARSTPFFETDLENNYESYQQHHFDVLRRIRRQAKGKLSHLLRTVSSLKAVGGGLFFSLPI